MPQVQNELKSTQRSASRARGEATSGLSSKKQCSSQLPPLSAARVGNTAILKGLSRTSQNLSFQDTPVNTLSHQVTECPENPSVQPSSVVGVNNSPHFRAIKSREGDTRSLMADLSSPHARQVTSERTPATASRRGTALTWLPHPNHHVLTSALEGRVHCPRA